MTRTVSDRFVQQRLDESRARRIAEILAEGLHARLKAREGLGRRSTSGVAGRPVGEVPTTSPDTAPEEPEDGP